MKNWELRDLLIGGLATYRLSELIAVDIGPYEVFEKFRNALGRRAATGNPHWVTVAELVHCPYCLGIWIGLLVWIFPDKLRPFLIPIALAGIQSFIKS